MFSIGLALYANNSSTMKVLSEDNIEALTDGEGEGSEGTYQELGTYPNRVWIFSDTHVMVLEGYKKTTNKKRQNECKANSSYICHVSTATPIYNASSIVDMIRRLLNTLFNGTSFFSWVFSLFK
jgi:hypothetical protein